MSPLCLGTMNFGPPTRTSRTATRSWTGRSSTGSTSSTPRTCPGNARASNDQGDRRQVVRRGRRAARQGGARFRVYSEMGSWPNESRLSALHIRHACEESLRRLQTDHADVYQMHHVYREATWDEIWQAFETLVPARSHLRRFEQLRRLGYREGERGREGSSFPRARVRAVHLQPRRADGRARGAPACEDYGMGVIPWSPLWRGLLAGVAPAKWPRGRGGHRAWCRTTLGGHRPQVEAYEKFCAELGEPPAEVALAWLLANPVVTAPIVGPRSTSSKGRCAHWI